MVSRAVTIEAQIFEARFVCWPLWLGSDFREDPTPSIPDRHQYAWENLMQSVPKTALFEI